MTDVKLDVFESLTCLHTRNKSDDEQTYPYLRTLLSFDTREFLNVLALVNNLNTVYAKIKSLCLTDQNLNLTAISKYNNQLQNL